MNPPNFFLLFLGELISRIREMGREDAVKILQAGCSIYRIITLEESMSLPTVLENDDSLVLQQNGGSNWISFFVKSISRKKREKFFKNPERERSFPQKTHKQIHYYPSLFILIVVVIILVFYVLFTIYVFDQYSFVKEKKYVVFSNAIQYA